MILDNKIQIGIKIICGWVCLCLSINITYIVLVQIGIVEDHISLSKFLFLISSIILTFFIMIGLWRYKSWAWRLFIICTILSWLYSLIYISMNYQFGVGIIFSLIGFILSAILWFLFKTDVKNRFSIYETKIQYLHWIPTLVFIVSFFFLATDLIGGLPAIISTAVLILSVMGIYKKRITNLNNEKD